MARRLAAVLVGLLVIASAGAQVADRRPLQFRDAAEETRFRDLTHELRCVMCQNQSIADSEAQIAVDLRREILRLMREGRSDDEIRRFLVDRYGEFVLYRPGIEPGTWLLWFGPFAALLVGGGLVWRSVRQRSTASSQAMASNDDGGDW
ncbi:cytochrome c-type biogenesis protein [Cognatilysobacter lacus]|uniref:Cytochrome c-type biogenesis protein n=1 Tax=Cognatilysobacter lacus TaxID=1643323 RepID=A0A5D8YS40_9GAMM|nr:cytochrome c-type biogenesis protein [Lysobacter lacus]TZF85177.1 cytochrome c-type biogenesis protein CcmH [Lysobacter lacus]